jgi:hypothetical protein
VVEEIALTSAGRALIDDADAAAQRTTLGLASGGTGDIWVEKAGDTMTGKLTIAKTSATTTREELLQVSVSDDANSRFDIYNGTSTNLEFRPSFQGFKSGDANNALSFFGTIDATQDTGTAALLSFAGRQVSGDPINGTYADIATRPLVEFKNRATNMMVLNKSGQLQLPTTGSTGGLSIGGDATMYRASTGSLRVDNQLGIGANTGATTFLRADGTITTLSSTVAGVDFRPTFNPASNDGNGLFMLGMNFVPTWSSSANKSGVGGSFLGGVFVNPTISGTGSIDLKGVDISLATTVAATIGTMQGIQLRTPTLAASTAITSHYAIRVDQQGSALISNVAGVTIADITTTTNRTNLLVGTTTIPSGAWSIHSASTNNSAIAGSLRIGSTTAATNTLDVTGNVGTTGFLTISRASGAPDTAAAYQINVGGTDTNSRFAQFLSGKFEWGDGTLTRDTNLYRSAADTLKTDDSLIVGTNLSVTGNINLTASNTIIARSAGATTNNILVGRISTDTLDRITISNGGVLSFGSGALANDTNLYRSAADTLKTDDNLIVAAAGTAANSVATIDATQTLTNKTLTTPTIGDFTNATHNHSNAAGGGNIGTSGISDDAITAAKMQFGMVANRQGGATGDATYQTAGTSNTDTSAKAIFTQIGVGNIAGAETTVTFPTAFNQIPLVVGAPNTAGTQNTSFRARSVSTTGFIASLVVDGTASTQATSENFAWIAIGQ